MNLEINSILDRADELLKDLEEEYKDCFQTHKITTRAKNITHEVLEKLRSALDHTMMRAWGKYISPNLSDQQKKRARIYFPVAGDLNSFHSTLGRGFMTNLDKINKKFYDFLLNQQPFTSEDNQWLVLLNKITAEGKHIRLTPQKRIESKRVKVTNSGGGSVSWNPSCVKYGSKVKILGAPIDPRTQRIVPTPGITEKLEIWVSFILEGYNVNALGFCKEAYQKTRLLIEEMFIFI